MDLTVELRKGGMEAVAILGPGISGGQAAAQAVLEELNKLGVTKTPSAGAVAAALEAAGLTGEVIVATGTEPKHGISAQLFPSFPIKETPVGEGEDPLDIYWKNITYPGEIVLRKTPASEGIPGYTLLGNAVPGNPGADLSVSLGGGVAIDPTGLVYASTTYGVVLFERGVISVHEAIGMDEERMEARMTILPDKTRDEASQVEAIVSALREINIVRGIDREVIATAVRTARGLEKPIHDVLAAQGQPAVDGRDAEYRVLIDLEKKALKVLEGDKVDYREKDAVKNVEEGEVIAEVIPATKPLPGFRVDGSGINPKTIHIETLKPGNGVVLSADGTQVLAESSGMITVKAGRFNVVAEYLIPGDVDIKTGNIHAAGMVRINGSVTAGFIVTAGKDLTVGGDVWEAVVRCDADIKIFGAITAGSKVYCKGDIAARFIQDSFVESAGDVEVALNITASEVYTKGKVRVMGSQGMIVGGIVNATMGVEAKTIGSPSSKAIIAVGLDLRVIKEAEELRKQLVGLPEELQRLHQSLGREFLKDPQAALLALPPTLRKNKLDVLKAMREIQQKTVDINARLAELNEMMQEQKEAVITVHGEIHAGTEVSVGKVKSTMSETLRRVVIHLDKENGMVTYRKF